MQQPIRYYITKRGEEPTVRSVKVAREEQRAEELTVKTGPRPVVASAEAAARRQRSVWLPYRRTGLMVASAEATGRGQGLKRLVQGAMRKRSRD